MYNEDFKCCLENVDIKGIQKLWAHVAPHLTQPKNDKETLFSIHYARTQAKSIRIKLRAYSHRWLLDNNYPSGLPDELKLKAERLYPKIVDGVAIGLKTNSELMKPIIPLVMKSMEDSVLESYADKIVDPIIIRSQYMNAKKKMIKSLLGTV